ncbi:hypothetical protein AAZX31_17G034900 [Glycine max]
MLVATLMAEGYVFLLLKIITLLLNLGAVEA